MKDVSFFILIIALLALLGIIKYVVRIEPRPRLAILFLAISLILIALSFALSESVLLTVGLVTLIISLAFAPTGGWGR